MKKITPQEIEAGMVLADDIIGPTGGVLMQAGMEISPSLGRRLKNWDVTFLYVEGSSDEEDGGPVEELSREDVAAVLESKFSHCKDNPKMRLLFEAVVDFKMNC